MARSRRQCSSRRLSILQAIAAGPQPLSPSSHHGPQVVLGEPQLLKLRGKAISIHSQEIKKFCADCAPPGDPPEIPHHSARPPPLGRLHSSLQTASTARCSRRSSRRPRPSAPTSASSLELVLLSGSRTAFGWSFRCVGGGREVQCARRCSPDRHRSLLLSGPSLSAPLTWAPGRCGCPLLNNAFAESPCVESAVRSTL